MNSSSFLFFFFLNPKSIKGRQTKQISNQWQIELKTKKLNAQRQRDTDITTITTTPPPPRKITRPRWLFLFLQSWLLVGYKEPQGREDVTNKQAMTSLTGSRNMTHAATYCFSQSRANCGLCIFDCPKSVLTVRVNKVAGLSVPAFMSAWG